MSKPAATLLWMLAIAAGCTSQTGRELGRRDDRSALIEQSIALPAPARGVQVETAGTMIAPGDDVRTCEVVALPGTPADTYYVDRIEAALSAHGEDLVVSAALPGSQTEAIMDIGASVPCTRAGEAFGEELSRVIATQDTYADARFPKGVGKRLRGGQKLAVEAHFVNESADAVPAKVKLSLHTVNAADVTRIARTASFDNFTIYTPPFGKSAHLGECTLAEDMSVSRLVRRTQRYGTGFRVWRIGGERDGELLWDGADQRGGSKDFQDAPVLLAAGEGLRFACDYRNTSDRELRYGTSAADETCTLEATFTTDAAMASDAVLDDSCLLFSVDADGIARK